MGHAVTTSTGRRQGLTCCCCWACCIDSANSPCKMAWMAMKLGRDLASSPQHLSINVHNLQSQPII